MLQGLLGRPKTLRGLWPQAEGVVLGSPVLGVKDEVVAQEWQRLAEVGEWRGWRGEVARTNVSHCLILFFLCCCVTILGPTVSGLPSGHHPSSASATVVSASATVVFSSADFF